MNKRYCIIGGGFTGLVAALRLAQAGSQVTLLEKSAQLGGLAAGFFYQGTSLEVAYHHVFRTDNFIIELVKELGLEEGLIWRPSSVAVIDHNQVYPFGGAFDLLRFTPLRPADRLRMGMVLWYLQHKKNWQDFASITASVWLHRTCGARAYERIWEPLLVGKFHHYAPEVSMAWLWSRVHTRAKSRGRFGAQEKLGYFYGGYKIFVDALAKRLAALGVEVVLDTTVSKLQTHPNNQVEVIWSNGKALFDSVLCTLPSRIFSQFIAQDAHATPAYLQKLEAMLYLGALCTVFTSPQSLSRYYWHNVHDTKSPFLVFLQHTNLVPAKWYQGQHVYYLGAYLPTDHELFMSAESEIERQFFASLKCTFPMFDPAQVTYIRTTKLPHAQHVVTTQYKEIRPEVQTPLPHVYLSNFSQIFPEDRGVNFAIQAGESAAKAILLEH
jgi:protoporphyrinogen oxidase